MIECKKCTGAVDESANAKYERDRLAEQLVRMSEELEKMELERREKERKLSEKAELIKYLEGQIEAYQYCMNCRR